MSSTDYFAHWGKQSVTTRKKLRTRLAFGLWVVAVSTVLCGCIALPVPPPTQQEMVGTWVNGETSLELRADHSYALTNAPNYVKDVWAENWDDRSLWTSEGDWGIEEFRLEIGSMDVFVVPNGEHLALRFPLAMGSDRPRCFELVREGSKDLARLPQNCYLDG
jgi:hypothetical protein